MAGTIKRGSCREQKNRATTGTLTKKLEFEKRNQEIEKENEWEGPKENNQKENKVRIRMVGMHR